MSCQCVGVVGTCVVNNLRLLACYYTRKIHSPLLWVGGCEWTSTLQKLSRTTGYNVKLNTSKSLIFQSFFSIHLLKEEVNPQIPRQIYERIECSQCKYIEKYEKMYTFNAETIFAFSFSFVDMRTGRTRQNSSPFAFFYSF